MEKNYSEICKDISGNLRKLRKDIPETMQAFSALAQAATRDGALDKKTKELIALALGVAARCDGCIGFHTEALVRLGATRQEEEEVLGMAEGGALGDQARHRHQAEQCDRPAAHRGEEPAA